MDIKWVDGFVVPLKIKFIFLLAAMMAIFFLGYIGYKFSQYPVVIFSVFLVILFFGLAFRKSWIYVDEKRKAIDVKQRFFFTWVKSYPYDNKYLYIEGKKDISPTFEYDSYNPDSIIHSIYLVSKGSRKGDLIFSSNKKNDFNRVIKYLSNHIKEDRL